MVRFNFISTATFALLSLSVSVLADDVLQSSGFTNCVDNPSVVVNFANITFDKASGTVTFDASGTSTQEQKVKASLVVTAYGIQAFANSFDPCDNKTLVQQLCPVPKGTFSASGSQQIPQDYLSKIPALAYSVPDIDADAQLQLTSLDNGQEVGCVKTGVTNGKTLETPAVQGVGAAILLGSLVFAGIGAAANAGAVGSATLSPSFGAMLGWFQGMALNGMLSVNYPPVYRSFAKNFGFSTGLVPWDQMQMTIDNFRNSTGGNLTDDSVQYLQNATLAFSDGENNDTTTFGRRGLLLLRDFSTSVNGSNAASSASSPTQHIVSGIEGYAEELSIPQANTFMTALLILAIIIAAIVVGVLGLKLILEVWAMFASFPQRLSGFRKRYWRTLANTITNLILLLYGIWTIWCIFQFTNGDSYAAKALAGVTWALFTAVLLFYTISVFIMVRRHRTSDGDTNGLYENKDTWHKYSFLYDSYRRGYWWLFVPVIVYMFAKGVAIAVGNGHGLTQTVAQLIIESLMFIFLLWTRPFATKGSNWINIIIQVVRVLSIICILVFVEELGIQQTTKTVTGVVLIAVQCGLTGVLGLLLLINALRLMFRENFHKKQRKEAAKLKDLGEAGEVEDLAEIPLVEKKSPTVIERPVGPQRISTAYGRPPTNRSTSRESELPAGAALGHQRSMSSFSAGSAAAEGSWPLTPASARPMSRQPTIPNFDGSTVGNGRPLHRESRKPTLPVLLS